MEMPMQPTAGYTQWVESWENTVTAVLAEQDAIRADIETSLRHGDLIGAASASFEHVVTSYQLGDRVEANSYLLVGIAYMQAAMLLNGESEESKLFTFRIPVCIDRSPQDDIYAPYEVDEDAAEEAFNEKKAMLARVSESVTAAEDALLLEPEVFSVGINEALHNAIAATCEVIFSDHPKDADSNFFATERTSERIELLNLAKQLASHLIINADKESTMLAFAACERLMHAAIYTEGRTLRVINQTIAAFEEMQVGPWADTIGDKSSENIKKLKLARQIKVGNVALAPLKNIYFTYEPYLKGSNDWRRPAKSRASYSMQREAKEEYAKLAKNIAEISLM